MQSKVITIPACVTPLVMIVDVGVLYKCEPLVRAQVKVRTCWGLIRGAKDMLGTNQGELRGHFLSLFPWPLRICILPWHRR